MKRPKPSLLRNALAGAWILGGILLAIGVVPYVWRSTIPAPFTWINGAAAVVLVAAFLGCAAASRSSVVGAFLVFVGFATVWYSGFFIVPFGVALYVLGLTRVRLADPAVLLFATGLLATSVAIASTTDVNQIVSLELLAAAMVAHGIAIFAS